jgi:hypothetical protein
MPHGAFELPFLKLPAALFPLPRKLRFVRRLIISTWEVNRATRLCADFGGVAALQPFHHDSVHHVFAWFLIG